MNLVLKLLGLVVQLVAGAIGAVIGICLAVIIFGGDRTAASLPLAYGLSVHELLGIAVATEALIVLAAWIVVQLWSSRRYHRPDGRARA